MTSFSVDPDILAGYRRRSLNSSAAALHLYGESASARGERDALLGTARERQRSRQKPFHDHDDLGALAYLNENELARHDKVAAEIGRINADIQATERSGAYEVSLGQRIYEHVKKLEQADESRVRAENGLKPARPPAAAPGPSTRM